jgi:glycosyltransferase involved in cell wall biosynthesis
MRILHLGKYWSPQKGGMERFVEDLARAQRAAGRDAFVLVHGKPGVASPSLPDDPEWVRRVAVTREFAFVPIAPQFLRELNRAIDDWQPDYIHIHAPNVSPFLGFLSTRAKAIPWVVHWHSDVVASKSSATLRWLYPFYKPFERALLERASVVIATSQPYLESSEPLQRVREKCVVVPLGIDRTRLSSASNLLAKVPWQARRTRLFALGRLTYYKGFDTLIRAVARCPDVELRIAGAGVDYTALTRLIEALQISDRVLLEGELSDTECAARYESCDLFCLPSRERTEALGVVLLEAMSFGKPILASALRGSGVTSVVENERNGLLATTDSVEDWQVKLQRLAADADLRKRLGDEGLKRLDAIYSLDSVEQKIHRAISSIVDPDAPRPEAHVRPLIVIPAKDEGTTIARVIAEIRSAGYNEIVVIDDGSVDETASRAWEAGARVLRAPLAMGAWGATQLGIRYAVRHNYTSAITMDADGQHRATELSSLFRATTRADVVIGAHPARGSSAQRFAWALFRKITGFKLEDLTSGFRLYNQRACRLLASESALLLDYQDLGVLMLLARNGLSFVEVEVRMSPRQVGMSRIFHSWRAVLRYMMETTVLALVHRRNDIIRHPR